MQNEENKKKFKRTVEQYKFSALKKLDKAQLEQAYKELYGLFKETEIENELLKNENYQLKQKLENKTERIDYSHYNPDAKGIDKVIFILRQNSKLMLSNEIVCQLLIVEPKLRQKWNDPYSSVIKYISRGVNFGRIIRYNKIGSGGFTYALPEWFDDDGNLPKLFSFI